MAEIFSATLVDGFKSQLKTNRKEELESRQSISVADYETIFFEEDALDEDGNASFADYVTNDFSLVAIKGHQRIYEAKDGQENN